MEGKDCPRGNECKYTSAFANMNSVRDGARSGILESFGEQEMSGEGTEDDNQSVLRLISTVHTSCHSFFSERRESTMAPIDNASISKSKGKKQANFSNVEIEQIARSWVLCSSCSVTGAQQKSDVYWAKIESHFQKAMADFHLKFPGVTKCVPRSLRSLSSKWGEINHDCAKFSGAMSQVVELNESGTNEGEQEEKAKALYQQTHKKGAEFTYEGAWRILKDNPKWQIAARLNDKHADRAAKQKTSKMNDENSEMDIGDGDSPNKHSTTPEMVSERPVGNKKAKHLAALENKFAKKHLALADSTNNMAQALNRQAAAMESVFELQLFSVNMASLDPKARDFILLKREMAERDLLKRLNYEDQSKQRERLMPTRLSDFEMCSDKAVYPRHPTKFHSAQNGDIGRNVSPSSPSQTTEAIHPQNAPRDWIDEPTTSTLQDYDPNVLYSYL